MAPVISLLALGLLAMSSSTVALLLAPVNLGTAGNFAVLAKTGVSTVPPSAITGAVGVSPAAGTFLTGFSLTLDRSGTFSTSPQVTGELLAASYTSPTPSTLTTAISNLQTAYTDGAGRSNPNFLNLGGGEIGSLILLPGLYKWTTGVGVDSDVTILGTFLDVFIFQIAGNFEVATGKRINLVGVPPANIFWVVAGEVTLGAGSHLGGEILSKTSVTLQTGASVNGRVLAQTQVALQKATVVAS